MNITNANPDLNLEYFEKTLEEGNQEQVEQALGNLISWCRRNKSGNKVEYGLQFGDDGKIHPASNLQLEGMEGSEGVTAYERTVGPWKERDPIRVYKGKEFSL